MHFHAFQRRVHIAHRAGRAAFFAHHMPRLQRIAQRQLHRVGGDFADLGKAELQVRRKPAWIEMKAGIAQFGQHIVKVHFDKGVHHETVV